MRIEQTGKQTYQPITITLETQYEAEVIMDIVSRIAGRIENSPRKIADEVYRKLSELGVYYRDENFKQKYTARGTIYYEDNAE